jgi:hypothetical protein
MKTRRLKLLALALTGCLFAPAALAGPGHHHSRSSHGGSGIVIYFGSSLGGHIHTARPKPPAQFRHHHGYRQGYRDGYHAGSHKHHKKPQHRHGHHAPAWKPHRVYRHH